MRSVNDTLGKRSALTYTPLTGNDAAHPAPAFGSITAGSVVCAPVDPRLRIHGLGTALTMATLN